MRDVWIEWDQVRLKDRALDRRSRIDWALWRALKHNTKKEELSHAQDRCDRQAEA